MQWGFEEAKGKELRFPSHNASIYAWTVIPRFVSSPPQHPHGSNPGLHRPTTCPKPRWQSVQFSQCLICFTQFQPIFRRLDVECCLQWRSFLDVEGFCLPGLSYARNRLIAWWLDFDRLHDSFCCHARDYEGRVGLLRGTGEKCAGGGKGLV